MIRKLQVPNWVFDHHANTTFDLHILGNSKLGGGFDKEVIRANELCRKTLSSKWDVLIAITSWGKKKSNTAKEESWWKSSVNNNILYSWLNT